MTHSFALGDVGRKQADLSDAFLCRSGHRTIRVERTEVERAAAERASGPVTPKLRPAAATLGYYGYSGPAYAAARTLRERMGSRLTANDGPLPTDYLGPHFGERANDDNDVGLFYTSNLGLITAASAIKSRFHPASLTMKLDASFGTHFLIRGQIRICKAAGNFFDCIDLGMEG